MQLPFFLELSESVGPAYREVIDGIGSRLQGIQCLLVGQLAAPSMCKEPPHEVDLVVATAEERERFLYQLRGIFRQLPDGSMLFTDGGAEFDLRHHVYTPDDLDITDDMFRTWWQSAKSIDHLPFPFRVVSRGDLLAFFLSREIAEDDEHILFLLRAGTLLPGSCTLPATAIARASTLYAGIFNEIADDLEQLGENL